jgi:uncharacterized protein YjdB
MPAPAGLEVGDSFALVAVIRGQQGTRLPPRAVEWATDSPAVLRVDGPGGIATALAPGTAIVTATCKAVTARLRVDVAAPRADDIVIDPMVEPLQVGEEVRLDATARDKHGWPVYRPVTWLSADADIAVVTPQGTIAGRAPGTVRITAALDDARASVVIPVLPPRVAGVDIADPPSSLGVGDGVVLTAAAVDRFNRALPGRPVVWSTSDPSVAGVTEDGRVTGMRAGSAVLTATCEGARAMIRIGVTARPEPAPAAKPRSVPRRRSRRARRRALLAAGTVFAGGAAWLLGRPEPLDDRGGAAPAAYVNRAVGVDSAPSVTSVTVVITRRPARSLRPDSGTTLAAEVRNAADQVVADAPIVWSSSDSTIARVDRTTGQVRAIRPGRVLIAAASGAGRDSVVVSVRRPGARLPAVGSIEIAAPPTLRVGDSIPLHALVRDAKGDSLPGAEVTWASSDASIATVEPLTGLVRAQAPGSTVILARSGTESSFAELVVLSGLPTAIQILGARPMAVRETLALRVAASDGWPGELQDVAVSWTSSDSSVAEVDGATGEVVGQSTGSVRITAKAGNATAWAQLTILPRPERLQGAEVSDPAEARLLAGVEECYGAVQARDLNRLRSMWHPVTAADQDRLRRLSRVLRDFGANVGDRIDRAPAIRLESATLEFGVPLTWRESASLRSSQPVFRAEFVRSAGRWELATCRIVPSSSF